MDDLSLNPPQEQMKVISSKREKNGFTLIETIISLALVTVVFVSLAQLFTLSVMQNLRSNEMSNAIFLAQQQIDYLRTLTSDELSIFPNLAIGESNDELLDLNQDGTLDFRRITIINPSVAASVAGYDVLVMVFPISVRDVARDELIANPDKYKVRAYVHTIVTR
ncbi:MAG: prepilin-type N-terminal cleavage/methylation domain-containing protein [Acidobacteriota bacterium]|nr:prepilin-type N-terminal cleavage/methylation domain-containing protein [Acidobacteriota bacterium]MDW3229092.1 prepilin-type N-terminal cleavage/methylation domain-containing protein [Acidobacteriota bacterium]MDY0231621.1 prepilin-type N-terminal cleavage/methylation domain-containing protein [Candidatus Saccharicenans sp.]